jgi:hypothetical protein
MENSDMGTQVLVPYVMIIIAAENFLLSENSMKIFRVGISSTNTVFLSPLDQATMISGVFIRNID